MMNGSYTATNSNYSWQAPKPLFDASGLKHKRFIKFRKLSRTDIRYLALLRSCRGDSRDRCFAVEVDKDVLQQRVLPKDYAKTAEAYNYLWIRHTHSYANEYSQVAAFFRKLHADSLRDKITAITATA